MEQTAVVEPDARPANPMRTESAPAASTAGSGGAGRFRPDVEGLRAVAVTLVLLFHAGVPLIRGGYVGVDVFFVISGFLITWLLVAELRRAGRISLLGFYARRARRLLPAAAVVLVTTFGLVRFLLPSTQWKETGGDIVASALYAVNWRLAQRSVDYLAEGSAPSPVQHFWSLAVEEQYYLVWPLLILLAAGAAHLLRRRPAPVLWVGLGLILVPSFVWSVVETANSPTQAFFETTTRMWELGIGAAVALGAGIWSRLPRVVAIAMGWLGLAAIAAAGLYFSKATSWPGFAAAVPVLGAAAVIVAGFAAGSAGPIAVLGTRPFRAVGGLSYSLYLWHWPLLVVASEYRGGLAVWSGLAVVAASVVPAWLTHRLVENPVRHSAAVSRSPRLALSLGASLTVFGVAIGLVLVLAAAVAGSGAPSRQEAQGAAALAAEPRDDPAGAPVDKVDWMVPAPAQATADVPEEYARGCQVGQDKTEAVPCEAGDPNGTVTVAVVGDSKVTQWLPALNLMAKVNGWRIVTYLKSSCGFALVTQAHDGKPFEACRRWTDGVLAKLTADPPDYMLTSTGQSKAYDPSGNLTDDALIAGLRSTWRELTSRGTDVVVIADNPSPGMEVYDCVARNPDHMSACAFDRKPSNAAIIQHQAVEGEEHVSVVDLMDAICPTARCAPVIGNVLLYRQGSHLTRTYIESLTPRLAVALTKVGMPARYGTSPTLATTK